jgi:two-component system, chemotaxis family, chemotaxis protein CheY
MGKQILVVDDSASFRTVVSLTLKREGYEVTEAADGVEALEKMTPERRFDLAICDLNMPRMNGLDFLTAAKAKPNGRFMPILMLTTETGQEKKRLAKTGGASGWLSKPFEPKQLVSAVSTLVR